MKIAQTYGQYINQFLTDAHNDSNLRGVQILADGEWVDILTYNEHVIHCADPTDGNQEILINLDTTGALKTRKVWR